MSKSRDFCKMAELAHDFENCRNFIVDIIWRILVNGNAKLADLEAKCIHLREIDADKKALVDQGFRDVLSKLVIQNKGNEYYENMVTLAIECCAKDLCNATLPVILLADLFDCQTINKCEELFQFVENRVITWKQDLFFNNTKNNLLRMCNDLLRRLSRSQNTVFCGRILLFLAKFFPLSERSGLNIVSEFNLDNVTTYVSKDESDMEVVMQDKNAEEGECNDSGISINYDMYRRFWLLQDYFRNPNQCYNKLEWKKFAAHAAAVLSVFVSFKLDDIKLANKKLEDIRSEASNKHVYFAKYLTSQKLLDLQLSDNNFRRYVLLQFLILFQYLTAQVKFKSENYLLTEEQSTWLEKTTAEIYRILEETPPDGPRFAKTIKCVLKREEYWNKWKNEGCPEFHPKQDIADQKFVRPERPRKRINEELSIAFRSNKILIGNAELTRLWNLCPDNMEACRSQKRDFFPSLEGFFEDAVEQNDKNSSTEEKYKIIYDSNHSWRALRLLSRRSPHFFTSSNQPIRDVPSYLTSTVKRLAKELPQQLAVDESKMDSVDKEEVGAAAEESDEELLDNADEKAPKDDSDGHRKDDPDVSPSPVIPSDLLLSVARQLTKSWKKLAHHLKFEEDELMYFESEYKDVVEQAHKMLIVWMEREKGTIDNLVESLQTVGEAAVAEAISAVTD